jgi:hypothetical protein
MKPILDVARYEKFNMGFVKDQKCQDDLLSIPAAAARIGMDEDNEVKGRATASGQ